MQWGHDTEQPNKLAHKYLDARWTKKGDKKHYGYKDHINIDKDTTLITAHVCTDASVHVGQVLQSVLRPQQDAGKEVWADSAYRSQEQEDKLQASEHTSQIHEHACKGKPLSQGKNKATRSRAPHAPESNTYLGTCKTAWAVSLCPGLTSRARMAVVLMNLTYNLSRVEVLIRKKVFDFDRVSAPKNSPVA